LNTLSCDIIATVCDFGNRMYELSTRKEQKENRPCPNQERISCENICRTSGIFKTYSKNKICIIV